MKAVHVLHLHSGNLYGGIERVLATLARHGLGDGTDQTFALCFEGRFSKQLLVEDAAVELLGPARASRPTSVLAARRRLRRWVEGNRVDVIVTHLPWTQAVFGPVLRDAACANVQWVHGPIVGWVGRWARWSLPGALICNSAFTRTSLPPGYDRLPAETIHYPLEMPAGAAPSREATRASLGASPSDVVVVQASRFEAWKGHEVLVRALARLVDVRGWTVWILGGAQRRAELAYERRITALVRELGLAGRVRFVGEQADVHAYLAAADVYCQPNLGPEPFGLVYVEALAAGMPVVASHIGALPEIVDDTTGILVEPGDPAALAQALQRLILDSALRRRLGRGGPGRAAELCDPPRQVARIGAYLASVAAHGAGAA